jgi:hypothetical protein
LSDTPLSPVPKRIADELKRAGRPRSFSSDGFDALLSTQDQYIEDLAVESIRLARRDQMDVVSSVHVSNAQGRLQQGAKRVAWLELFGGVLAGGGFAQVITNVVADDNPSTIDWLLALIITVVGAVMLAAAISRR